MIDQAREIRDPEKRYIPRWEVNNKVLYKRDSEADFHECLSKDISCSGACLCTDEEITPQQRLVLEIHLSPEVVIRLTGKTVWKSEVNEKFWIGLHFENVNTDIQDLILQYAFNCDKKSLSNHWFKGWQ